MTPSNVFFILAMNKCIKKPQYPIKTSKRAVHSTHQKVVIKFTLDGGCKIEEKIPDEVEDGDDSFTPNRSLVNDEDEPTRLLFSITNSPFLSLN